MRYNIFNNIHKGLRAMLYDAANCLQQTNFSIAEETNTAIQKLNAVIRAFEDHAHHEDHFVLPAIGSFEPAVVDSFEQEHVYDEKLGQQVRDSIQAVEYASDEVKPEMSIQLLRSFNAFLAFNLTHMAKEEDVINRILWRYYTDAELVGISQRIVANLSQWSAENSSYWMMKGLNDTEIITWLKAVRATAPLPVFEALISLAEKTLPASRLNFIMQYAGFENQAA